MRCGLVCRLVYCGSQQIIFGWIFGSVGAFSLNGAHAVVFVVAPVLGHSSNLVLFCHDGLVVDEQISLLKHV